MKPVRTGLHLSLVILLTVGALAMTAATAQASRQPYIHRGPEAPDPLQDVEDNDYWDQWSDRAADPYELREGHSLWIGAPNEYDGGKHKSVAIRVYGENLSHIDWDKLVLGGANTPGQEGQPGKAPKVYRRKQPYQAHYADGYVNFFYTLTPQVDGEWIRLVGGGTGGQEPKITKVRAWTSCYDQKVNVAERCIFKITSSCQLTELWYFPDDVAIDASVMPKLLAPEGSGFWQSQFVTADPYGQSRATGGVKFWTDGLGIADGQQYEVEFSCQEPGNVMFTSFSLDAYAVAAGEDGYIQQDLVCVPLPMAVAPGLALLGVGVGWTSMRRKDWASSRSR
jgi:hypothetical protein